MDSVKDRVSSMSHLCKSFINSLRTHSSSGLSEGKKRCPPRRWGPKDTVRNYNLCVRVFRTRRYEDVVK